MIEVTDKLGHEWRLTFLNAGRRSDTKRPIVEYWFFAVPAQPAPHSLRYFQRMPVPVFTDWFVPTCEGCGKEIDPDWCHCGDAMKAHGWDHTPCPMGCVCGYVS